MRIEMKRCVTAAVFILTGSMLFAGCGMLAEKHENIDQAMQSISQLAYERSEERRVGKECWLEG